VEDDPGLSVIQLWVNRSLEHANAALAYGSEGLLGIHWRTREIEPQLTAIASFSWDTTITSSIFWQQWAQDEFGNTPTASQAADIFSSIDSYKLPRPVNWINGPGGMQANTLPWSQVYLNYQFVEQFASLRAMIQGVSNLVRFDFWMNTFLYMRALAQAECDWGAYNTAVDKVNSATRDPVLRRNDSMLTVIPLRETLVSQVGTMISYLQQAICSTGTMGTVMNIEQHSLPYVLYYPGYDLMALMGYIGCFIDNDMRDLNGYNTSSGTMTPGQCLSICQQKKFSYYGVQFSSYCFCGNSYGKYGSVSYNECNMSCTGDKNSDCGGTWRNSIYSVSASVLPSSAMPSSSYTGTPRLIVPTARSDVQSTELFTQRVMVLSQLPPSSVMFNWRPMGSSQSWQSLLMNRINPDRNVYDISLGINVLKSDFEYYIQATVGSTNLFFPADYASTPFTVIVIK